MCSLGDEVFVKRLVHVPEDGDLGHGVSLVTSRVRSRCSRFSIAILIREILLPLAVLALVVLTFVLEIPPILREAEALIAKGVAWSDRRRACC